MISIMNTFVSCDVYAMHLINRRFKDNFPVNMFIFTTWH